MSAQPWVCGACRSINQPREGRCYHCRTPRELVEADPSTLIVAGAGSRPAETPIRPTAAFQPSGGLAFLAQVLLAAALGVAILSSVLGADVIGRVLDGDAAAGGTSVTTLALIGGLGLAVAGAALVAFALWLSRVVSNLPTIGLGWPNVTPNAAIFESIVPGVNLYRVPAILRDIVNRLEPDGKGDALIAGAWLGLVGGVLLPRVASWGVAFVAGSLAEFTALRVLAGQLGLGLTVAGGIVLIVLIQWIETRMDARSRVADAVAGSPAVGPSVAGAVPAGGTTAAIAPAAPAGATTGAEPVAAPRPAPAAPSARWTDAVRAPGKPVTPDDPGTPPPG
jgi:hypothetical protein